MPRISLTTPEGVTHDLEITAERMRIGRAEDNDIVVPDGSVSSYHGEITLTDSGIHIHDRGSTNGTHVNGQRVEEADIPWGGEFRLGNCPSVLIGDQMEESAPAEDYSSPQESAASYSSATSSYASSGGGAVITGLGATPCPSSQRRGFGPKVKPKDSGGTMIMLFAVLAILACGAAAFMIMNMKAA